MNKTDEALANLLTKLAEKFGTTSEYLWKVLVKQAFVNGITDLIQIFAIIILSVVALKAHRKFCKPYKETQRSWYYHHEDLLIFPMIFTGIILSVLLVICFLSIDDVFNSFFNPEYWALNNILKQL